MDRETGRSRGFGFVTYADSEAASAAIQAMDQRVLILFLTLFGYLLYYTSWSCGNCNALLDLYLKELVGFNQKIFIEDKIDETFLFESMTLIYFIMMMTNK